MSIARRSQSDREVFAELARRTAMLDAVAASATQIVTSEDWRKEVPDLLRRLGEATDMSRVTLFEVHNGPNGELVQSCRFDWAEPGLPAISNNPLYQHMSLADENNPGQLAEWPRRRQRGEVVQATLREVTGYTRHVFLDHGTLSFLSVPIMVYGKWWGFLGFDDCKIERVWNSSEIDVLKIAAALIAGAIERNDSLQQLRLSEERYALAERGANDGLWDWDVAANIAYLSPRLHELLGFQEGALGKSIDSFFAQFPPEDLKTFKTHLEDCFSKQEPRFLCECRMLTNNRETRWVALRGLIVYRDGKAQRLVGSVRDITERLEIQQRLTEIETKRANLARYFSPNIVNELMQSGGRLDFARTQIVTVLFVDIVGFTRVSSTLTSTSTMALLREYLAIFEEAVFTHGGTLDKFLGDGLMATFGTPMTGLEDATNAVRCARMMGAKIVSWNAKRIAAGLEPLRVGIGLHHGEVVLGDIGGEQRVEFAVIGNTVNIANRIEAMTRQLNIAILASQDVMDAVRRENNSEVLDGFVDFGQHRLRGHAGVIRLWGRAVERASGGSIVVAE
ncbi:MAG TPA: adenylate/guanylate cyclase domain-containing protein [Aestuariivirgaceae bacterium]|jgi:PAS domain S-box-containing protein